MKILTRFFILAGLLLSGLLTLGAQSAPAVLTYKTVLVLSPFQLDLSSNLVAAQAMRDEFGKATDLSLDVYYEYLDLNRFPDAAYQQQAFDLLTGKYKNKPVDLVIVGGEAMLKLWLAQRAEILPNTPIVFFDVFTEHMDALKLPANVTGVSGVEDCEKSVRWVFDAMPAVNEIVLVGGVGKIEQGFLDHIRKLQEDLQGQVKFTNLSGLSLAEIKQRVLKLPKTSIVLYHPMFEDAEGNKYRPLDVLREMTAVSSVPVISGYDLFIGTGIIGGYMYSIDQQARDAAQIGLRVLRGEAMNSIPIEQDKSNRFIFDHLALQHFDIPLSALPPNSMIKNRQYSFWELYRLEIISTSTGIVALLLLIVFLLGVTRQLNRTRLALAQLNVSLETQVQERTAMLNQTNTQLQDEITERKQADAQWHESERRLSILMSNLPGMAYRCRNNADWTMEFSSEGCYDLTGYTAADLIGNRIVAYGQVIHPKDQTQVWDAVQAAVLARTAYDLVYRIVTASGVEKWVMERGRGVFGEQGELIALEGFISDITQQKYIEQTLRHAQAASEVRMQTRTIELTQANEALRQYEINFEAVVNNASDGISIATATGETIFANAKFAEIVGYPLAELSFITMKDLAHPEEYPMLVERLRRRVAGESAPNQYETAIRQKDGRKVPIELTASKILWQGQPADLVIIRDITERKQSEKLIAIRYRLMDFSGAHSLKELLQKTLDEISALVNSPIGFCHFVEADQITLSLQAWSTRTEQEFCTAVGKDSHYSIDRAGVWVDAVHLKRPVIHNDYASLSHRKGLPEGHAAVIRELVAPIIRDDRVVAILGVGNKPTEYTDQDVKLVAYLADVAWEIAARKKIEQELQQHRDHLEQLVQARTAELVTANERLAQEVQNSKVNLTKYTTLFEVFPLGVTIAAADGKILESNQEAVRILGISRREQEQRAVDGGEWSIIRPDGTPMPADEFASVRALKEQRRIENIEMGIVKDDQQITWINVTAAPIPAAGLGVAVVYSDVTERKRMEEALRESEARTATILRLSPIVIGVSTVAEGRYTDVNDAFERVLGYSQSEVIGRTSFELNLWADNHARAQILGEIQAHGRVENFEILLRRKSGEIFPALAFITPITLHDTPCLLTMMMDITERKRSEEQLRETRDALQTIIYSSPLAILALDHEDRVTMWNPAAEAMFGWSEKQILGQTNPSVPENKLKEYDALRQATLNGMAFSNRDTLRMNKDGTQFPVSLSVAPLRGQHSQVIGRMHIIADITERKKLQEELRHQATTDELTRVSNRRHFMELAQSEIKRAVRFKRPPAIALIDIDHFKQVNDTFGHAAGDQALVALAKICKKHIREIDVFARFGGDEFILLLPETNQEQAFEVLERVRLALMAQPFDLNGKAVALTISSGIASLAADQVSIDTLLSQADQALYRAKEAGRNKVVRYDKRIE